MDMSKEIDGNRAVIVLSGRLDAKTSPELQKVIVSLPDNVTDLLLDFENLKYLSSAGLRVIQIARKRFSKTSFVLRKVQPVVMEVLTMTGFASLLTFEE